MPIVRHRHTQAFTVLPNALLRDKRFTLRDIGLLAFMLSLPDDWDFSVTGLAEILPQDGKNAVAKSLTALEAAGYLKRERIREASTGRVEAVVWTVSDTPSPQPDLQDVDLQDVDLQDVALQDTDLQDTVIPPQIKNLRNKERKNKEPSISGVCEKFERFWSAYPKKVGKQAAKKAFSRVKVPVETLLSALQRQKCSAQWSKDGGEFIPNPATWLNQGRWEDELVAEPAAQEAPVFVPDGKGGGTWILG